MADLRAPLRSTEDNKPLEDAIRIAISKKTKRARFRLFAAAP